ncbi:MAG: LytTR family DNA-binding domain-containing protein [Bacteroidota bacterium]
MWQKANHYLPWIVAVGLALGVANFAMGVWPTLGRSMVLQVVISFLIGYPLLLLAFSEEKLLPAAWPDWARQASMAGLFFLVGILGGEGQRLADYLLFSEGPYRLLSAPGTSTFNGILSIIIGWMTLLVARRQVPRPVEEAMSISPDLPPSKIPIRKGESTTLYPLEEVCFFEAYDNYSFLHDIHGERLLCNYSLAFLETRLADQFLRVHRSYLINPERVGRISPHLKGRYVIEFSAGGPQITSSASYSEKVKALIRL